MFIQEAGEKQVLVVSSGLITLLGMFIPLLYFVELGADILPTSLIQSLIFSLLIMVMHIDFSLLV